MGRAGIIAPLLLILAVAAPVHAGDTWEFRLSPYAWLAGMKGELGAGPTAPAVPIDVAPSDVIEDIETALMLVFNAKKGRHGVFVDMFYADIVSDAELLPPPINLNAKVGAQSTVFTAAYQYEVFRDGPASADVLVGARYWRTESSVALRGGNGPVDGRRLGSSESWTDPLLGVKGHAPLGNSRFYVEGGVSVGGFGIGSDRYHEISAVLGYRWSEAISTGVGYRYFDVKYDDSGFLYDVTQQGWQLGLSWSF
jgi:hypothetical protein